MVWQSHGLVLAVVLRQWEVGLGTFKGSFQLVLLQFYQLFVILG